MNNETQKILDSIKESGLKKIFERVEAKFPEKSIYLVGGALRNALMGIEINDLDFATSLEPHEVLEALKGERLRTIGIEFGTITWSLLDTEVEITTFRCDETYSNHRHPESLKFGSSKLEDLERRDFTVNAMMYSSGEGLYDPFGGLEDLKNKTLKAVGDPQKRFTEDALRILRLFRFHLNYNFTIETVTLSEALEKIELVDGISKERVVSEFKKTFKLKVHMNLLEELLLLLSKKPLKSIHSQSFVQLNKYDQLYYLKKIDYELKEYILEKSHKKIYDLYTRLDHADSLIDYQRLVVSYISKNRLSPGESEELWHNAKHFGLEFSEKIKSFKFRPIKNKNLEKLRGAHSGKALGKKILEEQIESSFLVNDF